MSQRHAVITGAASGIGAATAKALRRKGYRITALDLNDPGPLADLWHPIDLDVPPYSLPEFDLPVDVLVNAAGLPPRPGSEAKVLRVNFLALRRVTEYMLPHMKKGGAIVNVASKAGAKWRENIEQVKRLISQPNDARLDDFVSAEKIDTIRSYDLSKEAVVVWTKIMTAGLVERGLRMNAVSPAAVETPILGDFTRALGERATRGIELTKRSGTPGEIASVIAFLASPSSEWVRGCNIEADGGLTAILDTENTIRPD